MKIEPLTRVLSGFLSSNKQNINSDRIEEAFQNTISRDGSSPNAMQATLDMGLERIINVGAPVDLTDAVRLQDIATLNGGGEIVVSGSYNDLTDVPTEFPPSAHTHNIIDVTGLQAVLDDKSALGHTHTTADVVGLAGAIDAEIGTKVLAGTGVSVTYNAGAGTTTIDAVGTTGAAWTDITGKPSTFTPSAHTHPESDVTSLVSDLAGKAATVHSHSQADITGLTSALSGKAATSHTHSSSDITSFTSDVRAQFSAGTGISIASGVITATGGGGSGVPYSYVGAWENGITTGTAASTNTSLLNSLISTLNSAGGGMIYFNAPGDYQINGAITLKSNVGIRMSPGAQFYWAGGTTGNIFQTSTSDVMLHGDYQINLHEGYAFTGTSYNLHSHLYCNFDLWSQGISPGHTMVKVSADSTSGAAYPILSLNTAFNNYRIQHVGQCNIGLWIVGLDTGGGTGQVVTNCTFYNCQFANVQTRGFKIDRWADTITFSGNSYAGIYGSGGIGYAVNEVSSPEASVYNIRFEHLAIDTFGSGLSRTGCYWNLCKLMYIDSFFQNPTAENGQLNISACTSYIVQGQEPSSGDNIFIHSKGISTGT